MSLRIVIAGLFLGCAAVPAGAGIFLDPIFGGAAANFSQTTLVTAQTRLPGDKRVFVASKTGVVTAFNGDTMVKSTFLDLSSEVKSGQFDERGLLGMTFDPNYAQNGRYYVFVTTQPAAGGPVYSEVRRYTDPLIANEPEKTVMRFDDQNTTNHQAGWIDFAKDGTLLIAVGDGGDGTGPDIRHTGQDASDLRGSILRIDVNKDDFAADPNNNYGIPAGNLGTPGAAPEVYAYGVRNPFRNSVAPDGNILIADVGQDAMEEISILTPGTSNRNLGWSIMEGTIGGPAPADYLAPSFIYDHSAGDRAIIGGYVYRGTAVPELIGRYVFGDQQSGNIWSIGYDGTDLIDGTLTKIGNIASLSSFGETVDGELLVSQYTTGATGNIFRIASTSPAVPEPATWAMAILGFFATAGMMRRRAVRGAFA